MYRQNRFISGLEEGVYFALFFLLPLVFFTQIQVHFTLPKLVVLRSLTLALIILWIFRWFLGERHLLLHNKSILYPLAALALFLTLSATFSLHLPTALEGIYGRYQGLWTQMNYLLLFFFSRLTIFHQDKVLRFFIALVIPAYLVAVYAIVQHYGFDPIYWDIYDRSASSIGNPVILAGYLSLILPLGFQWLIATNRTIFRLLIGLFISIILLGIIFSYSRGGWIGLFAALIIFCGYYLWRRFHHSSGKTLTIIFLGLLIFGSTITGILTITQKDEIERITNRMVFLHSSQDPSLLDRKFCLLGAFKIIKDYPGTGVGPDNFRNIYPYYRARAADQIQRNVIPTMVHNGYLHLAVTAGIPALLAYMILIIIILWQGWKRFKSTPDPALKGILIALAAAIIGYLVQDLFGWQEIAFTPFFWIILGMLSSITHHWGKETVPGREYSAVWTTAKQRDRGRSGQRINPSKSIGSSGFSARIIIAIIGAFGFTWLLWQDYQKLKADHYFFRAIQLAQIDDWYAMEGYLKKALAIDPDNATYWDKGGLFFRNKFLKLGQRADFIAAQTFLLNACQKNPYDPYPFFHLASLLLAGIHKGINSKLDKGYEAIKQARDLDPNNSSFFELAARYHLIYNHPLQALEMINRLIYARPPSTRHLLLRGDIFRKLKKTSLAEADYQKALKLSNTPVLRTLKAEALFRLALIYFGRKELQTTLSFLKETLKLKPDHPAALSLKGQVYKQLPQK